MSRAKDDSGEVIMRYAFDRYVNDAEFHAKVDTAVALAREHIGGNLVAMAAIALAMYSHIIVIYSQKHDGTVAWKCPFCGEQWDR